MKLAQKSFVYFLKPVGFFGPIKIGCSAFPIRRLKGLMSWSPFDLEIMATVPGGPELEANLHACFCDLNIRGEWFTPDARLLACIEIIKGGAPIADAVDLNDRRGSIRKGRTRKAMSENTLHRLSYARRIDARIRGFNKHLDGGRRVSAPNDVYRIMNRWRGDYRDQDGTGIRPTDAELARLDQFLSNLPAELASQLTASEPASEQTGEAA